MTEKNTAAPKAAEAPKAKSTAEPKPVTPEPTVERLTSIVEFHRSHGNEAELKTAQKNLDKAKASA